MARRKVPKPEGKPAEPDEAAFLVTIQKNPADSNARVAYADWLEEHDRPYEAAVQRDRAGVSEVWLKLRRKTDGLFADREKDGRNRWSVVWTRRGRRWRSLKELVPHMTNMGRGDYAGVAWKDIEVVVVETRPQEVAALPLSIHRPYPQYPTLVRFRIDEPAPPALPKAGNAADQPERRPTRARRR